MANFTLTEIKSLSDFLDLRFIHVEREQRRFSKNVIMSFFADASSGGHFLPH